MKYTPIVGTLGYVLNPEKTHVLMVHRIAREHDAHFGKYNGVGGKLERDEEIVQGMKRELLEETGLTAQKLILRGTVNWTNFGPKNEDWLGFIFIIESFSGTPFESNAEGKLEWVALNKINDLPMWEGDRFFLPLLFDNDPRVFHGYMPYEGNQPKSFSFSRI